MGAPTLPVTTTTNAATPKTQTEQKQKQGQGPFVFGRLRYIHHFDSYSLVKQLYQGGYTIEQAITSMKAVRALLARYLDVAQDSLVSKSDVENVGDLDSCKKIFFLNE